MEVLQSLQSLSGVNAARRRALVTIHHSLPQPSVVKATELSTLLNTFLFRPASAQSNRAFRQCFCPFVDFVKLSSAPGLPSVQRMLSALIFFSGNRLVLSSMVVCEAHSVPMLVIQPFPLNLIPCALISRMATMCPKRQLKLSHSRPLTVHNQQPIVIPERRCSDYLLYTTTDYEAKLATEMAISAHEYRPFPLSRRYANQTSVSHYRSQCHVLCFHFGPKPRLYSTAYTFPSPRTHYL